MLIFFHKVTTFTRCSTDDGFFFLASLVSTLCAGSQTVINNPVSLTPGVKGQTLAPINTDGQVGQAILFHSHIVKTAA